MSGVRVIAAMAVVLLVAGCTGGDDGPPQSLPVVTSSATSAEPSPSPSEESEPAPTPTGEAAPEPRDGMHEYSQAGVDAFTRYVIDVINYTSHTSDVTILDAISTEDCQFCASSSDQTTAIREAGGRIEGGQLEPTNSVFDIIGPAEGFETSAGVELIITASETIDGEGNVRNSEVDRERYIIFAFVREDEEWRLAEARSAPLQPS